MTNTMNREDKMWWGVAIATVVFCLLVCGFVTGLGYLGFNYDRFQGQPALTQGDGEWKLIHCADGEWRVFERGEEWTDGNLHLITEGEYRGGYEVK